MVDLLQAMVAVVHQVMVVVGPLITGVVTVEDRPSGEHSSRTLCCCISSVFPLPTKIIKYKLQLNVTKVNERRLDHLLRPARSRWSLLRNV